MSSPYKSKLEGDVVVQHPPGACVTYRLKNSQNAFGSGPPESELAYS